MTAAFNITSMGRATGHAASEKHRQACWACPSTPPGHRSLSSPLTIAGRGVALHRPRPRHPDLPGLLPGRPPGRMPRVAGRPCQGERRSAHLGVVRLAALSGRAADRARCMCSPHSRRSLLRMRVCTPVSKPASATGQELQGEGFLGQCAPGLGTTATEAGQGSRCKGKQQ